MFFVVCSLTSLVKNITSLPNSPSFHSAPPENSLLQNQPRDPLPNISRFNSTLLSWHFFKFIQIFDICLLLFLFVFCQAVALSRVVLVRFCLWSDVGFRNLLLVFAVKVMVLLVNRLKMKKKSSHNQHPDNSPSRFRGPWTGSGSISRARCTSPSSWGRQTAPGSSRRSGHTRTAGGSTGCLGSFRGQLDIYKDENKMRMRLDKDAQTSKSFANCK